MSAIVLKPMVELQAMSASDLFAFGRQVVKLAKTKTDASKDFKESGKALGKVIAEIKRRYNEALGKAIPTATSFAEYYEAHAGKKPPTHGVSCSTAWSSFVETGFNTETDYDNCSSVALERSGAIVTAVKHDLTHDTVKQASDLLRNRPDEYAATLKALLATVKPPEPMDAEQAAELLKAIVADGHLPIVISTVGAEIAHCSEETAHRSFLALDTAFTMFSKNPNVGETKVQSWVTELQQAEAPIQLITAETPQPVANGNGKPAKASKKAAVAAAA